MIFEYFGLSVSGLAIFLYIYRKYRESYWMCESTQRLDDKVVIITGANSGIGKETARELAKRGAIVVLACRNQQNAQEAVREIRSTTTNGDLIIVELDLASLSSVKKCAENILSKFSHIDILVNNAGVVYPTEVGMQTSDGFEIHFGVNHLGHFLFTNLLIDRIKNTKDSRIVVVTSLLYKQGQIDLNIISKWREDSVHRKGRNPLYADSKLCNLLHAQELAKRLKGASCNTGVYAVCPGFVYSGLFRNSLQKYNIFQKIAFLPVAYLFMKSSKQGAQTPVYCSVSEDLKGTPFGLYRDCQPLEIDAQAKDTTVAAQLWDFSTNLLKSYL